MNTLTRVQLYEAVWSTPLGQLAERHGLTYSDIVHACAVHQVPRPRAGYWIQKRHGTDEPPPPLPPMEDNKLEVVSLKEQVASDEPTPVERFAEDDEVNRVIVAETLAPPVEVPASLRNPHPAVAAAMEADKLWAAEERLRNASRDWAGRREPASLVRANVAASATLIGRAYRVMNALLRAAEDRGYEVSGKPDPYRRSTLIKIMGKTFDVRLYEPSVQKPHVLTKDEQATKAKYGNAYADKHDFFHSEELCLQLRPEGGWMDCWQVRDGKKVRVEDRLNKLFIAALRQVDKALKWEREREQQAAAAREAERQRVAEEERQMLAEEERKREHTRVQSLLNEVEDWKRSRTVRAYLRELRRRFAEAGRVIESGSDLDRRLRWAEEVARRFDPFAHLQGVRPADSASDNTARVPATP